MNKEQWEIAGRYADTYMELLDGFCLSTTLLADAAGNPKYSGVESKEYYKHNMIDELRERWNTLSDSEKSLARYETARLRNRLIRFVKNELYRMSNCFYDYKLSEKTNEKELSNAQYEMKRSIANIAYSIGNVNVKDLTVYMNEQVDGYHDCVTIGTDSHTQALIRRIENTMERRERAYNGKLMDEIVALDQKMSVFELKNRLGCALSLTWNMNATQKTQQDRYTVLVDAIEENGITVNCDAFPSSVEAAVQSAYSEVCNKIEEMIYEDSRFDAEISAIKNAKLVGIIDGDMGAYAIKADDNKYYMAMMDKSNCGHNPNCRYGFLIDAIIPCSPEDAARAIEALPPGNCNTEFEMSHQRDCPTAIVFGGLAAVISGEDFYAEFLNAEEKEKLIDEFTSGTDEIDRLNNQFSDLMSNGKIKEALEVTKKIDEIKQSSGKTAAKTEKEEKENAEERGE